MVEKKVKSALPIYAVGVTFVICGFLFPMYRIIYPLLSGCICAFVYIVTDKFGPYKTVMVEAPVKQAATGDETADEIITNGRTQLGEINRLSLKLKSSGISKQVEELKFYGGKIFDHVEANPEKIRDIRQFMDYYLPTSLKLIKSYESYKSQGAGGENIDKAVVKIEGIMGTIAEAYKKVYDNLFEDNTMDIVAEVNVMEKLLKAEGLAESNLDILKEKERRDN